MPMFIYIKCYEFGVLCVYVCMNIYLDSHWLLKLCSANENLLLFSIYTVNQTRFIYFKTSYATDLNYHCVNYHLLMCIFNVN